MPRERTVVPIRRKASWFGTFAIPGDSENAVLNHSQEQAVGLLFADDGNPFPNICNLSYLTPLTYIAEYSK